MKTEEEYKIDAEKVGVHFLGMQKTRLGPPFPLFGDPVTRTTFTLQAGETLGEALARKRWQFGIGEFRP